MLGAFGTHLIEEGSRGAGVGFFERSFVVNPGHSGVFQSQRFGLGDHVRKVVTPAVVREVAANRVESGGEQHFPQFGRRQIVGSGGLYLGNAIALREGNRFGDAPGVLRAQGIQLEANGSLEGGAGAGCGRGGVADQGDGQQQAREEKCFHERLQVTQAGHLWINEKAGDDRIRGLIGSSRPVDA